MNVFQPLESRHFSSLSSQASLHAIRSLSNADQHHCLSPSLFRIQKDFVLLLRQRLHISGDRIRGYKKAKARGLSQTRAKSQSRRVDPARDRPAAPVLLRSIDFSS